MTTDGTQHWRWTWRKGGVMNEGTWLAFGLVDSEGPPVEDEPWSTLRSSIYVLAREIYEMDVVLAAGTLTLTGSVTSEKVRERLGAMFGLVAPELRNELVVAAPFECAGGDSNWSYQDPLAMDGATGSLTRYPAVTPGAEASPGAAFNFEVDLAAAPDGMTEGGAVELANLPAGWTEVTVDVEIFCDALIFEDAAGKHGVVTVLPDGSSRPAVFRGRIRSDAVVGDVFKLTATFEQAGRHAGSAVRRIRIEPGAASGSTGPAAVPPTGRGVELVRDVRSALLTVKIIEGSVAGVLTWSLSTPRRSGPFKTGAWREQIDLKGDTSRFARELLQSCPNLRPGRKHVSMLRGIGERIWQVAPDCFKGLYAELRAEHGPSFPIQFVTDEPHVPWEMMHPDEEAGMPEADHLFMTHPVARWFGGSEGGMREGFGRGLIASFVPEYDDGSGLPAAVEEGRRLVSEFGAEAREATYEGFTGFLGEPLPNACISILHFAGHAAPSLDGADEREGLRMTDGWVSSKEVHSGVRLGMRDGTFVVLNACSAGTADETLGVVGGWPTRLATRGFGGVLAPIWAVQDEHASSVVLHQLDGLTKGRPLGEAMRDARVCYRNASATPYAYLCHGDVMARMS